MEILQAVMDFFDEAHLEYTSNDNMVRSTFMAEEDALLTLCVAFDSDNNILNAVISQDLHVPCDFRRDFADYFARCNSRVILGHFEQDMIEGDLCFRLTQWIDPALMTCRTIQQLVLMCINAFNTYRAGFIQIMNCGQTAANAFDYVCQKAQAD